ncbi:MAG: hypothetical protein ACD_52C00102G0005 [uncultured bacterium]|nr:MAG: hypothetical protein ACD_52C00102G0005 [uncultured bacterium]
MRKQFPGLKSALESSNTLTARDMKTLLYPLVAFLLVLLIAGIALNTLWSKISTTRAQLAVSQKENTTLKQKAEVLQQKENESSLLESGKLTFALPLRSSSIYVLSQVKRKAADNMVVIEEISVSEPRVQAEISQSVTSLKVTGTLESILTFIDSLSTVAPLVKTENVKTDENDSSSDAVVATLSLTSYYSSYPEKIPALTQAISSLSPEEEQVISDIAGLEMPTIPQNLDPDLPNNRNDPFNL